MPGNEDDGEAFGFAEAGGDNRGGSAKNTSSSSVMSTCCAPACVYSCVGKDTCLLRSKPYTDSVDIEHPLRYRASRPVVASTSWNACPAPFLVRARHVGISRLCQVLLALFEAREGFFSQWLDRKWEEPIPPTAHCSEALQQDFGAHCAGFSSNNK